MTVDRATLLEHLAKAERHVAQGEAHIGRQEALLAELERDGHDTKDAVAILATLRETQTQHILSMARLLKALQQRRE
jgi:hypothetical protein